MGEVDLHTHTTASDGMQGAEVNIRLAEQAGLSAVAITDHDTVAGLPAAFREGERRGIEVVPGVEISTVSGGQDIHVLGYYFDERQPVFLRRLEQLRNTREVRNEMLLERLRQLGCDVTLEEVKAQAGKKGIEGSVVGRPHIAEALVRKGYAASIGEAFEKFLGREGAAYVNPPRIDPFQAVDWIHEAGGAAVLAHPGLYRDAPLAVRLIEYGLDGIEVYHSDHSADEEKQYLDLARKHDLMVTAGSDFHGERQGVVFHAPIGFKRTSVDVLRQLKQRADDWKRRWE